MKTPRAKASSRAKTSRSAGPPSAKPSSRRMPSIDRAPPRGKYDRSHTPEERMKAQRVRLYTAATRVFAKRGFSSTTVDDICTEAGVSRRTFYEHFEDLHDLLVKLHDRLGKMAFAAIETYVNAFPLKDAEQRTRAGVEGILGLVASFPAEAKIMFRELRAAGPQYEARREALLNRFAALVAEGVANAYAAGSFSVPPDDVRVFGMVSAIESVGMRYVERGEHDRAREAAPALIDMLIRIFK